MIKNLEVKNFKSIKSLNMGCKKVNVFIGKPNTGKSNILESLGIFCFPYIKPSRQINNIRNIVRFEKNIINLFYDQEVSENIKIRADTSHCEIKYDNGNLIGNGRITTELDSSANFQFSVYMDGRLPNISPKISPFKFYKFLVLFYFPEEELEFLLPPNGENLFSILMTNKSLKKLATDVFSEYGLKIVFRPQEKKMEVQKQIEDIAIQYPYSLVSDTLQRVIFHLVAIETNKDSVIIFEEPEAHAFPYYTKFLAERIALDKTNQYFISTHNPYFLLSVLEKTPKSDIGIFITYFQDYQTKVRTITEEEMPEILDLDASIFFNLDRFLEQK